MTIYLDTCSMQRPLDDRGQLRIRLEAEAILSVLDLVEAGAIELVTSDAVQFETDRNPYPTRQQFAREVMAVASAHVALSEAIERQARMLNQNGIQPLDALHLASAIDAGVDYFCTCDDAFLTKAKRQETGATTIVDPIELAERIDQWQSRPDR
jgi:predicted nucleic acid-binding protein